MAKRKRRDTMPSKTKLKRIADQLWSIAVRRNWNDECAVCRKRSNLQSHHLIRRSRSTCHRYSVNNGICLCASHHNFDPLCSPHGGEIGFVTWLEKHHPAIVEWVLRHQEDKLESSSLSKSWYIEKIRELREHLEPTEFEAVCGEKIVTLTEIGA